jgi:hypothetical protein
VVFSCVVVVVVVVAGRGTEVVVRSVVVDFDTVSEPQAASKAAPVKKTAPNRKRMGDLVVVIILLRCRKMAVALDEAS